jgi:hypothetical protein
MTPPNLPEPGYAFSLSVGELADLAEARRGRHLAGRTKGHARDAASFAAALRIVAGRLRHSAASEKADLIWDAFIRDGASAPHKMLLGLAQLLDDEGRRIERDAGRAPDIAPKRADEVG